MNTREQAPKIPKPSPRQRVFPRKKERNSSILWFWLTAVFLSPLFFPNSSHISWHLCHLWWPPIPFTLIVCRNSSRLTLFHREVQLSLCLLHLSCAFLSQEVPSGVFLNNNVIYPENQFCNFPTGVSAIQFLFGIAVSFLTTTNVGTISYFTSFIATCTWKLLICCSTLWTLFNKNSRIPIICEKKRGRKRGRQHWLWGFSLRWPGESSTSA